jgi:chromate reductase, NAD(P)H dehydrogenase (quinone)
MKVVVFAGALRQDSVSKKLIHEAMRLLNQEHGLIADYIDLKDYPFPVYDNDIEQSIGIPDSIAQIGARIGTANALVIASPEYNGGISSVLKTLVDWLSRLRPDPLEGKFLLLLSASPSSSGGVQGLWHTRVPFEALGVHVFPYMVAVPRAQTAFDEHGALTDRKTEQKLRDALHAFVGHVEKHHPVRHSLLSNAI